MQIHTNSASHSEQTKMATLQIKTVSGLQIVKKVATPRD
jgi:hypothetical protein